MQEVAIISGVRTPIGRYMGTMKDVLAYDLGALVLNEAVKRAKLKPEQVDDVAFGQCYQNGEYVNIARMSLLNAGWPESVTGITIDRRCASSLDAIVYAAMKIQTGNAEVMVSAGVEHMSSSEFYIPGYIKWGIGGRKDDKWGYMPRGHGTLAMWGIPFFDRIQRGRVMSQPIKRYGEMPSMMSWGDLAAKEEGISREECDKWALRSHQRACAAIAAGKFKDEIIPVSVPQEKGPPKLFDTDETPRSDTTLEQLAKLSSVLGGVSTAGNSSSENDGAAACVLTTDAMAKKLDVEPMAYVKSSAVAGADPTRTWLAVPMSVEKALKKAGLTMKQIDLIEIQEAFAGQVTADIKELGLSAEEAENKVNVNGSGISLGHPVGATGVMRLVTLLYEMKRRNARYGLETICGGGGQGICAIVERKNV